MKILIACEYSGTVRDAFTALGHDATSCDLLPSEKPGKHYQGDVFDIIGQGLVRLNQEMTLYSGILKVPITTGTMIRISFGDMET